MTFGKAARWVAATAPAILVALLPKIACPACWPAYAGALSSLGVTFLIDARYLFALTAAFLAVALFFLGFRARRRRGYGPLGLGVVASAVLLVGKFALDSDPAMYAGVGLLMAASLWNSWPRKEATSAGCPSCETDSPALVQLGQRSAPQATPCACGTEEAAPIPPTAPRTCCASAHHQGEMS